MERFSVYFMGTMYHVEDLKYSCIQGSFKTESEAIEHKKYLEKCTCKYL